MAPFARHRKACKAGPHSGGEGLSFELKPYCHHASLWPRTCLAVARHVLDPRILEDRDIVIDRLLGVIVEPKHRRYFLCAIHGVPSSRTDCVKEIGKASRMALDSRLQFLVFKRSLPSQRAGEFRCQTSPGLGSGNVLRSR